ncbi:MAG: hypothetical protein K6A63_05180 [Acholeplasmatales bacterium]|nr:hypothetical protein [Acholeplasmatales bacterium]
MRVRVERFIAALMLIPLMMLTGCYDLGSFEDLDDYYDSFSDATFYNKTFGSSSYSIEDYLYNEETQNDYNKEDNDITFMSSGYYSYLTLKCERDMTIRSVAFFVKASSSDTLYYEIYHVTGFDTGNFSSYDAESKSSTDLESPLNEDSTITKKDDWAYCEIKCNEGFVEGNYLVIKFVNNTYDGKINSYGEINFLMVNLLVRAEF